MAIPQSLQEREALRAVDLERRRQWHSDFVSRGGERCASSGCVNPGACPNPSHWTGNTRSSAFADLCGGRAPVKLNAFGHPEDPRDVVDAEESAAAGVVDEDAPIADGPDDNDAAMLSRVLRNIAGKSVNEARVRRIVEEAIAPLRQGLGQTLTIKIGAAPAVPVGLAHKQFPLLCKWLTVPLPDGTHPNVWLAGPAGSGKTHAASQFAKIAPRKDGGKGLPFYFNGAVDSEYKLSGFVDASGRIVDTAFRHAFTHGGVYLFDEIDRSMAAAVMGFNAGLSNGHNDFPGSEMPIPRHPDFYCLAGANTKGLGGNVSYATANRMDGAFLDRFVMIDWPYDAVLERTLAGDDEWTSYVQTMRNRAGERFPNVIISPRASIIGAAALRHGLLTRDEVIDGTIRGRMGKADFEAING